MQEKAALHTDGPLLIIAGAGSGKTTVLTRRMAHLVSLGVNPYNILAITFTNKAAREMKERVHKLIPQGERIWLSTFHSFCARLLRREIENIGYSRDFTIYDMDDCKKLVTEVFKDLQISDKSHSPNGILYEIGRKKDELITPQVAVDTAETYTDEIAAKVYMEYQKRLYRNSALDFDDLLLKTLELFSSCPDILDNYSRRFEYIMVDEYQDTNTAQYQLVRYLALEHDNLCVVGDDDQSIYGWRGANIRNILDFEKDFPNAQVIKLEQNYRSTKTILTAANAVISNNKGRKGKSLWTNEAEGNKINFHRTVDDRDEARYIADTVEQGLADGGKYSDFAVLYRVNAQSRAIEESLVSRNIKYRIFGGLRFYERKEIKDILAYLRTILNPRDEVSIKRVINTPRRGIGNTTVVKISQHAKITDKTFYEALSNIDELPNATKTKLNKFVSLIEELKALSTTLPMPDFVMEVLTKTGYFAMISDSTNIEDKDRERNLNEFVSKAAEFGSKYEGEPDGMLGAFLEEVALVADIDELRESEDYVSLMTIHSAKGLEFNKVFLPGFEDGIFPLSRVKNNEQEMEEERRLCYVALTRARYDVYITAARSRLQYNNINSNPISQFFDELPAELVNSNIMVKPKPQEPKPMGRARHGSLMEDASMQPNFGKKWDVSKIKKVTNN